MENLDFTIAEYLKKETNYSILITGNWGVGKTHYYRNKVAPLIEKTSLIQDDSKKYKPIHISLFGLSSIREIQTQIFISLFPLLNNKKTKLSLGLGKLIAKGIFIYKGLGDFDKYVSNVKPNSGDWIQVNQLVICFDDLERRSPNLPIEELIGYINSLVENSGAKILVIANEDEINNETYHRFKEKVIGITFEFLPNIEESIDSIIQQRYGTAFKSFVSFLENYQELLVDISRLNNDNLRAVIFALDKLFNIFYVFEKESMDISTESDSILKEKMEEIVRFTFSICFEYKNQQITYNKRESLDEQEGLELRGIDVSLFTQTGPLDANEIEETYADKFVKRYYKSRAEYKFFTTIYNHVTGAVPFKFTEFQKEFDICYNVENEKVLPQYEVLDKLNNHNINYLNDTEYKKLTREMVSFAEKGKYRIGDYLTIFYYAMRFDNLLNYSKNSLKNRLKKGLERGRKTFAFTSNLEMYLSVNADNPHNKELTELRDIALSINRTIGEGQQSVEVNKILTKIESDWSEFISIMYNSEQPLYYKPIFQYASAHKFYLFLNKCEIIQLVEFSDLIIYRNDRLLIDKFIVEVSFWEELHQKLSRKSKSRGKKSRKNLLLNQLSNQIEKTIGKIKAINLQSR